MKEDLSEAQKIFLYDFPLDTLTDFYSEKSLQNFYSLRTSVKDTKYEADFERKLSDLKNNLENKLTQIYSTTNENNSNLELKNKLEKTLNATFVMYNFNLESTSFNILQKDTMERIQNLLNKHYNEAFTGFELEKNKLKPTYKSVDYLIKNYSQNKIEKISSLRKIIYAQIPLSVIAIEALFHPISSLMELLK